MVYIENRAIHRNGPEFLQKTRYGSENPLMQIRMVKYRDSNLMNVDEGVYRLNHYHLFHKTLSFSHDNEVLAYLLHKDDILYMFKKASS